MNSCPIQTLQCVCLCQTTSSHWFNRTKSRRLTSDLCTPTPSVVPGNIQPTKDSAYSPGFIVQAILGCHWHSFLPVSQSDCCLLSCLLFCVSWQVKTFWGKDSLQKAGKRLWSAVHNFIYCPRSDQTPPPPPPRQKIGAHTGGRADSHINGHTDGQTNLRLRFVFRARRMQVGHIKKQ